MKVKIGRNQSCPCGSGKKYKYCCIDKADDNSFLRPENFLCDYRKLFKESKIKQCLHPDKDTCSDKIIKAHSIQNNKILKRISTDGLVYMPCPKPDNPFAPMTEYGRKQATVFTGFCGHHDKSLFQDIEDRDFIKSEQQIFLYTYRCFAVEYHKKQEVVNIEKGLLKRKPSFINNGSDNPFAGTKMAVNDLEFVKQRFDKAIVDNEYDILTSIVWEFPKSIKFAASGFEAPTEDLEGNELQDLSNIEGLAKHVFIIVFPEGENTYCIISWLKDNDLVFDNYFKQLMGLTEVEKKNFINNILPMISENIVVNPEAWDKLEQTKVDEFGMLIWGFDILAKTITGETIDRLSAPTYDLFSL